MNLALLVFFGVILAPILVMAIFLLNGKGAFLIAGYNTMNKDKQETYDEKALCRFVGMLLLVIIFCILLIPAAIYFEMAWLSYSGIAIMLLAIVGAVIYMNTGNRFRVNTRSESSTPKTYIVVVAAITIVIFLAVGVMLFQGESDTVVNIHNDRVEVKGMYGLSIDYADITEISLIEKSMREIGTGSRTNGFGGFGDALKGHFRSGRSEILLFVRSTSSPTIKIECDGQNDVYISFRDGNKTEQVYREMISQRR